MTDDPFSAETPHAFRVRLDGTLRAIAKRAGADAGRFYRRVTIECFLARLIAVRAADWSVKGGVALRRAYARRSALQALRAIKIRYSDGVSRAWFIGMNHHLRHHAPSELLNEIAKAGGNAYLSKSYMDRARRVLDAARIFAEV